MLFIFSLLCVNTYGQSITNYAFSSATTPAYSSIVGGTPITIVGNLDEGFQNGLPIGFDFWYMGQKSTTFSVSTNGWMVLGQTVSSAVGDNNLNASSLRNVIAPLWDDLAISNQPGAGISYFTTGTAGSRILTVQWQNVEWAKGTDRRLSFQVKLYEATGAITFVYINNNTGSGTVTANRSASIGVSGASGQYHSVTTSSSSSRTNSENNTVVNKPDDNRQYTFTPSAPAAPTVLTTSDFGFTHLTLNWTAVTSNSGYIIYRSTNSTSGFVEVAYVNGGAINSYTDSGLTGSTTYYYRIAAVREIHGPQSSTANGTTISCEPSYPSGLLANYKFDNNLTNSSTAASKLPDGTLRGTGSFAYGNDRFITSNRTFTNVSNNYVTTNSTAITGPQQFTISTWFKTSSGTGGVLIGFSDGLTGIGDNSKGDRHLYMGRDGKIYFGVYPNSVQKINSSDAYKDDEWHQATGVLSAAGMFLYIDGKVVASNPSVTSAEVYNGFWRIGYGKMSSAWDSELGTGAFNSYFIGALDDVLIFNRGLSAAEVAQLYKPNFKANDPVVTCAGDQFNLSITSAPGASFAWTGPNGYTSSTREATIPSLTNATKGTYTVTITTAGGCVVTKTNTVGFNTTTPGLWRGTKSTAWDDPDNWCGGAVPTPTVNVTIPNAAPTSNVDLTTVGQSKDITVQSNRTLTISGNGDLQVAGSITNAGTITASNGKVTMNGTTAQVIPANVFADTLIKDLTLNNTAGVTLNGALRLTGVLAPTAGIFQTNGYLTLASTASVATIPANASVRGSVKVERFLKGGAINPYRTYRMLSSPVYDNTTDFVNTNVEGNRSAKFSQLIDDMIISGANGVAGGFDVTHNNQASAWTYSTGFIPITNINTAVNAGRGMYVFFRGNRSNFQAKTNAPYTNPEDVVMDFDGVLNQQDVTVSLPNGGSFLGNPYASTIDWNSVNFTKTNVNNAIWIWNPATRSYATYKNGVGLLGGSNYIASGQSFFVQTNVTGAGSLTFKESVKVADQQPPVRLMAAPENSRVGFADGMTLQNFDNPRSTLRVSMKTLASYGEDETVMVFNEGSSAAFDDEDATHIDGEVVNITTLAGTKKLAINFHAPVTPLLDIPVHVNAAATGSYTLKFNVDEYFAAEDLLLKDNYLNKVVPITSNLVYSFNIDKSVAQTFGANRFSISAATPAVLPVTLAYFTANKQNNGVSLAWKTLAETNLKYFEVHRAGADGLYVKLGEVDSKGVGVYGFVDSQPKSGVNYYRLSPLDLDGNVSERKTIAVEFDANALNGVVLYPNPVIENFTIKLNTLQIGLYSIEIYDVTGKKIKSTNASNVQLLEGYQIAANQLPAGVYFVEVRMIKGGEIIAGEKFIKR